MKKNIIIYIAYLAIILLIILYFQKNVSQIYELISNIKVDYLIFIGVITVILIVIYSINYKLLYKYLGLKLKFIDYFSITSITTLLNIILPFRGGGIFQAMYFKKMYKFNYAKSIVLNLVTYYIAFLILSVVSIFNLFILKYLMNFNIKYFGLILSGYSIIFLVLLIILVIPVFHINIRIKRINEIINSIFQSWKILKKQKNSILILSMLAFITFFLSSIMILFSFKCIGINLDVFKVIFISSLSTFSMIINIMPGNLGIQEGAFSLGGFFLNIKMLDCVISSLLLRVINFIIALMLSGILFFIFVKKKLYS